jgi:DNA-3-methyladenine glycosylase II
MTRTPPPDESLRPALEALAACDADVARAYEVCGLPPIRIMTSQQVSVHAARAILGRLLAEAGPLTPESFLALDEAAMKRIGFSRQKLRYGRTLAEEILDGRIDLDALAALDDETAIAALCRVKGIGRWTAEIYLLFSLQRPDVWPVGDLAVCVAAQRLKGLADRPSQKEMLALGEAWRPHRSAAARFLWHFYRHDGVPV